MHESQRFSELRIFIIDDDELILSVMEASLKGLGADQVTVEKNARSALDQICKSSHAFDIVFCDLNMPDMDGLSLLHQLAINGYPNTVVLISGEDQRILKAAATLTETLGLRLGGSISKPITRHSLYETLRKVRDFVEIKAVSKTLPSINDTQLRSAIVGGELEVHYQPKVSALTKAIVGAEALVRWRSEEHGLLTPNSFIPLAEESDLVSEIFDSVAQQSITAAGEWCKQGQAIRLSINLSVRSLDRLDLPEFLSELTRAAGLRNDQVVLEVTESQLMSEMFQPVEVLCRMAMMGFHLSIDDFGTGYSSMSKLIKFPFNELKIDRLFVDGATSDEIANSILQVSASLGKKLNMTVVAEGVETTEDWDTAVAAGSDIIQGYLISKPLAKTDFEKWIIEWNERWEQ